MKICPKCQQQFPNGFQYCPNDTELLITNEENVRYTKPISAIPSAETIEAPAVEVVPITNPVPPPTPKLPLTPTVNLQEPVIAEPPQQMPFRQTEVKRTTQEFPKPEPRPVVNQQPPVVPAQARPNGGAQTAPPAIPARPVMTGSARPMRPEASLNFAIPEGGGLLSRLFAGLQNIGDAFSNTAPPIGAAAQGDFQFLLPEESLSMRIGREVRGAWTEFRRDPRRFAVELIRGEGTNLRRRNALLAGTELAIVFFVTLYFIGESLSLIKRTNGWLSNSLFVGFAVYLVGCFAFRGLLLYRLVTRYSDKLAVPKLALEVFNWGPVVALLLFTALLSNYNFYCRIFPDRCMPPEVEEEKLDMLAELTDIPKMDIKVEESPKATKKQIGGSKPTPKPASGGGGGGRQQPTPPSKGVPPQMALTPQIIMPNPEPPKIKNPSLVVASTIYGDPKALPPMKGPIGDPTGVPAPPSSGPGTGAGIGRGSGTGVGGGEGGGLGPGRGGNTGGGDMGLGGGRSIEPMSGSLRPTILYKEKAKYTEEARQNKVQGTVVLNVVFTSDGRITNIRVVRGLPDGLTEKAIEAAQKIRFNPAVRNGAPVSVRGNLEFTFNLY